MNELQSRKQLLLVESELNRALLNREWHKMADQVHGFARGVKTFNSMASAAATLVAGLGACRCASAAPAAEKPSWFRTILFGRRFGHPAAIKRNRASTVCRSTGAHPFLSYTGTFSRWPVEFPTFISTACSSRSSVSGNTCPVSSFPSSDSWFGPVTPAASRVMVMW